VVKIDAILEVSEMIILCIQHFNIHLTLATTSQHHAGQWSCLTNQTFECCTVNIVKLVSELSFWFQFY